MPPGTPFGFEEDLGKNIATYQRSPPKLTPYRPDHRAYFLLEESMFQLRKNT